MNKKKIQLIITGVLVLVFIVVFINSGKTVAKKKSATSAYANISLPPETISQPAPENMSNKNDVEEGLLNVVGRDPFKRQSVAEDLSIAGKKKNIEGIAGILLTGIIYDSAPSSDNFCLINGEEARVNGKIGGFIITGIKEDYITLVDSKDKKEYKLTLWED